MTEAFERMSRINKLIRERCGAYSLGVYLITRESGVSANYTNFRTTPAREISTAEHKTIGAALDEFEVKFAAEYPEYDVLARTLGLEAAE